MNQKDASDMGMKHTVWRHRGCSLCSMPATYMCNQCRAEVNEQGSEREVHASPVKSIVGNSVPADFMYV